MNTFKQNFYWLPVLVMVGSGIAKLAGAAPIVESMTAIGMQDKIVPIAIIELICVAIFIFPRTQVIGFFLVCSYWGGAIAADWGADRPVFAPVIILSLFWLGFYLRKPSAFGMA